MSDAGKSKQNLKKAAKLLLRLIAAVLCILLLIALSIGIYLSTSLPAPQLSRYLTSYLQQGFTVESLHASGGTLVLRGVRLKNPDGFTQPYLASADSVAVAPQWGDLLRGRQRFRLIALEGIKVNLEKNGKGVWNFEKLRQILAARKPPAEPAEVEVAETFLEELVVKNGAFNIQGQGIRGIALRVFNLATKGSADSTVDLAFEDAARNRYALKGKARAGKDAAIDLALTVPSLSLKAAAELLKLKNSGFFEGGRGALQLNVGLHKGEITASGDFSFSGLRLPVGGKGKPVAGLLHFSADYGTQSDAARLRSGTLTVDNIVKLHAAGNARSLKGEREFAIDMRMEEADLGKLNGFLPPEIGKALILGGRLRCDSLHLEGNRSRGLKRVAGTLQLRDGALTREGRLAVAGLSGTVEVSGRDSAVLAKGRLWLPTPHDKALLQALDMPFALAMSPRFKPLRGEVPALSARFMGIPVGGRFAFDAAKANPFAASLRIPETELSTVNPLIKRFDLRAGSGTASATLEAAGKSARELSATVSVRLSDLRGSRGKDSVAVKKGSVGAKVQRSGGRLTARGDAQLSALSLNGKKGDARFGYRVADDMVHLDAVHFGVADTDISISRLSARIPPGQSKGRTVRYPISLDLDGAAIKQREMLITGLAGRIRGSFNSDGAGRWLEGTADLASGGISRQGKAVGAPAVHAVFSRSGGKGELGGQLLGGKLAGVVSFNPFAPQAGATFEVGVSGAETAAAAKFVPKGTAVHPSAGAVDLRLTGRYSGRDGLACRFDSKGSGIVLTGAGGKTLVTGAGFSLAGSLAGDELSVGEAVLSAGPDVALKLKGKLVRALSPKREGSFAYSLPATALNGIIDPFVNLLPRFIQEATVDGTLAADGRLDMHEGRKLLDGAFTFKGGRIELASQNLLMADINGRLPFSFDLSVKAGGKPKEAMEFSRENYPHVLEQLRRDAAGGEVVTVGKLSYGALELGKLSMHVLAGNGVTEISSLSATLYEGALLGRGHMAMRERLSYRGDLLINGVSMRALCRTLPNLEGYISGRVDGVISLSGGSGGSKGLSGITGFAHLWAREGGGEKMLVSKEFLQRLAKQKLSGFFFSSDRRYDEAEIKAMLERGDLTFDTLKIVNTNPFGVRDLNVAIAPGQNQIALEHLLESIKEAAVRGKAKTGDQPGQAPAAPEFKWED